MFNTVDDGKDFATVSLKFSSMKLSELAVSLTESVAFYLWA